MKRYGTRHDRRDGVRRLALAEPTLSVRAMARRLGLSKDTVRRDLAELRREGRLGQPVVEDQRLAAVAQAIAAVVPGEPGDGVIVSVFRHRSGPSGHRWCDSWTGTPEGMAERILTAVPLTDDQIGHVLAAVREALEGAR